MIDRLKSAGVSPLVFDSKAHFYFWTGLVNTFLSQTEAITAFNEWTWFQWFRTLLFSFVGGATALKAYQSISPEKPKP